MANVHNSRQEAIFIISSFSVNFSDLHSVLLQLSTLGPHLYITKEKEQKQKVVHGSNLLNNSN